MGRASDSTPPKAVTPTKQVGGRKNISSKAPKAPRKRQRVQPQVLGKRPLCKSEDWSESDDTGEDLDIDHHTKLEGISPQIPIDLHDAPLVEYDARVSVTLEDTLGSSTMRWRMNPQKGIHKIYNDSMEELGALPFRAEVDKGFKSSATHDCYICQKKNHFQVSIAANAMNRPAYVGTEQGLKKIASTVVTLNGAHYEDMNITVGLEQSKSDRSKRPFSGIDFPFENNDVSKITVGRLHFTETTANNMRKRGQPNPDQRYFALVVSLEAVTEEGQHYTLGSHCSDQIIVRASNPGQFETEPNSHWVKGRTMESIYHEGAVGINNDSPNEALCVDGNIAMTGSLIQPSDRRVKTNIVPVDPAKQLANMRNLKLYEYDLKKTWADATSIPEDDRHQVGVIAQELQQLMPDAVKVTGDRTLPDGSVINNLLVVNKDRLIMEGLGAIGELARRQQKLEDKLADIQDRSAALKSTLKQQREAPTHVFLEMYIYAKSFMGTFSLI